MQTLPDTDVPLCLSAYMGETYTTIPSIGAVAALAAALLLLAVSAFAARCEHAFFLLTQAEAEQTDTEQVGAPPSDNQDQKTKPIQSKEERARNAARRREQEKQQLREELRREWEAEKAAEDQTQKQGV